MSPALAASAEFGEDLFVLPHAALPIVLQGLDELLLVYVTESLPVVPFTYSIFPPDGGGVGVGVGVGGGGVGVGVGVGVGGGGVGVGGGGVTTLPEARNTAIAPLVGRELLVVRVAVVVSVAGDILYCLMFLDSELDKLNPDAGAETTGSAEPLPSEVSISVSPEVVTLP